MDYLKILSQAQETQENPIVAEPLSEAEQETTTKVPADANSRTGTQRQEGVPIQMFILVAMIIFIFYMMFRAPKKQQQKQQQMVKSLNKNDRVRTIGGIIGTVVDVRDDEIVLKVDESNNTKIKVLPSAIGANLSSEKK